MNRTGFEKQIDELESLDSRSDRDCAYGLPIARRLIREMQASILRLQYIAAPTEEKPRCKANVIRKKAITRCNRTAEFESEFCASHRLESSRIKGDPRKVREG